MTFLVRFPTLIVDAKETLLLGDRDLESRRCLRRGDREWEGECVKERDLDRPKDLPLERLLGREPRAALGVGDLE